MSSIDSPMKKLAIDAGKNAEKEDIPPAKENAEPEKENIEPQATQKTPKKAVAERFPVPETKPPAEPLDKVRRYLMLRTLILFENHRMPGWENNAFERFRFALRFGTVSKNRSRFNKSFA